MGDATRHLTSRDVTSNWIPARPLGRRTIAARHTTRPDVTTPVPGALPKLGRWAGRIHATSPHVTSHLITSRRGHSAGGLSQHITPHDLTSHHTHSKSAAKARSVGRGEQDTPTTLT